MASVRVSKIGLEVVGASNGIEVVGRDFFKTQFFVKSASCFHVVQGVQQDSPVSGQARMSQNSFCKQTAYTRTSTIRADIQTLHFACVGIVHSI